MMMMLRIYIYTFPQSICPAAVHVTYIWNTRSAGHLPTINLPCGCTRYVHLDYQISRTPSNNLSALRLCTLRTSGLPDLPEPIKFCTIECWSLKQDLRCFKCWETEHCHTQKWEEHDCYENNTNLHTSGKEQYPSRKINSTKEQTEGRHSTNWRT